MRLPRVSQLFFIDSDIPEHVHCFANSALYTYMRVCCVQFFFNKQRDGRCIKCTRRFSLHHLPFFCPLTFHYALLMLLTRAIRCNRSGRVRHSFFFFSFLFMLFYLLFSSVVASPLGKC